MSKSSDIEKMRQALDDSVLTHTGRSIGDLASQRVMDDIWPLMQALAAPLVEIAQAVADVPDAAYVEQCPFCYAEHGYMLLTHTANCPVMKARVLTSWGEKTGEQAKG